MSRVYHVEETPVQGTMLLEASAGTGKTYALERMVATLVGRDNSPLKIGEILVVTFTNRAAREMRERIRNLLSLRASDDTRTGLERERCRLALNDFDRAPIYTIHGFCQMVLSTWPFESAAPFRQELEPGGKLEREEVRRWISSPASSEIDRTLFRAAYNQAGGGESLVELLSEKLLDSSIPHGSVLLPDTDTLSMMRSCISEANGGRGKLISALQGLSDADWSDESIADLLKGSGVYSRTKDASARDSIRAHALYLAELGQRTATGHSGTEDSASPSAGAAGNGMTVFQTLVDSIFGDPAGSGVKNHFLNMMYAAACWNSVTAGRGESLRESLHKLFLSLQPFTELVHAKKTVVNHVERYMQCEFDDIALGEIQRNLARRKDESGRWGYDDLIARVAQRVSHPEDSNGNATALTQLLRGRYKAALIDEFQDTDPLQWSLFHALFGRKDSILALIGDPKQSIYGFRGVGLQAYKKVRSSIPAEARYRLETNYRSRPQLVEAANRLFSGIFRSSSDASEPVGFEPVQSGLERYNQFLWPSGEIAAGLLCPDPGDGEKIKDAMARSIVHEIRALLDPDSGGSWRNPDGDTEPVSASDIAVLVRSRTDEENVLGRLRVLGIPAVRLRSNSVFRQEIADSLLTLFEAFESPKKTDLWRRVLLEPFFRTPPSLLDALEQAGRLDELSERGEYWKSTFEEGRATSALDDFFRFSTAFGRWAAECGNPEQSKRLSESWPRRILGSDDGERLWQDWRHLAELIQEKQSEGVQDIRRIRIWMREQAQATEADGGSDALRLETERPSVRVLTLHSAKGLEFPLVFIHGGYKSSASTRARYYRFEENGTLIVDRIRKNENSTRHRCYEWEEEKRLWYVGFTRASSKVWICRPNHSAPIQIDSLFDDALNQVSDNPEYHDRRLPLHLRISGTAEKAAAVMESTTRIEKFVSENPRLFHRVVQSGSQTRLPAWLPMNKAVLAPLPKDSPAGRDPVTSSYSSLLRQAAGDAEIERFQEIDRDIDREIQIIPEPGADSLPITESGSRETLLMPDDRGALYGTFMHAVFEEIDFSAARTPDAEQWFSNPDLSAFFEKISSRYYPPDWYRPRAAAIKTLVFNALRSPIPGLGPLCNLEDNERRAELEFLLSVPCSARLQLGELETDIRRGYLKGFIDLIVRHEGRWWVVDWKTNVPPGAFSPEDYSPEVLQQMMDSHHYHLQYELYLLSLVKTLSASRGEAVDWENEIGGAAYLFIRGMHETDSRGVFMGRPSLARMQSLASEMGLEGVVS